MGRRGYDHWRRCAAHGCRESRISRYELKREYADAVRYEKDNPWRCLRHDKPESVLSVHNLEVTHVTEPSVQKFSEYDGALIGTYWDGSGFIYGPGFRAWPEDFPVGTQLVIAARIVLPQDYTPPAVPERPPVPKPAVLYSASDVIDLDR